jgi:hypothetical protein
MFSNKLLFALLLCCAFIHTTLAQHTRLKYNTAYDTIVLKKAAMEMCKCMKSQNVTKIDEDSTAKKQVETCMSYSVFKLRHELKIFPDKADTDFSPEIEREIIAKVSFHIAPYLMRNCSIYWDWLMVRMEKQIEEMEKYQASLDSLSSSVDKTLEDTKETSEDEIEDPASNDDTTYTEPQYPTINYVLKGKIKSIEHKNLTFLWIETEEGKTEKLLWLREFTGQESLIGNSKKIKGKKVSVEWYDMTLFDGKNKKYQTFKEIIWLEEAE